MNAPLRLGTRGSLLARTQAGHVAASLSRTANVEVELVIVRTAGDDTTVPLSGSGSPGVFVAALRDQLLTGHIDLVVHSFKDLPSAPIPGLGVAAVPPRADARDAAVVRDGLQLHQLPAGSRVGTSSPRRAAALARVHPHLDVVPLRGNVDSRLGRVSTGELDAVILAMAGLTRLGLSDRVSQVIDTAIMVPAPAQGALAVECRSGSAVANLVAALDDAGSRATVAAERAVLAGIGATCTTAVGAHAQLLAGRVGGTPELRLCAELTSHRGVAHARVERAASWDPESGVTLAERLGALVAQDLCG